MAASIFPFLTDAQSDQLVANGLTARAQADFDPLSVVKLFTPDAGATWLLSEIDLEDPDIAFTLCDLGMGFAELGLREPCGAGRACAACWGCRSSKTFAWPPAARATRRSHGGFSATGGRNEVACAFIASARDACA